MKDGDTRWIQRGAYDLMDVDPDARVSSEGMPKCRSLYGSLAEQLKRPDSFVSQLKHLLSVRQSYGIAGSHQTAVPGVKAPGLLIMIHDLPDGRGTQITALNFGGTQIDETLAMPEIPRGPIVDMLHGVPAGDVSEEGEIQIQLAPYEGKSLRIVTHYHTPT